MMRTTVSTQPQIIIVVCCITLRRSGYDTAGNIRSIFMYIGRQCSRFFLNPAKMMWIPVGVLCKVCVVFFTML